MIMTSPHSLHATTLFLSITPSLTILNLVWRQREDFLMPEEGLVKGNPGDWVEPERVKERWASAFSWEVLKEVAEAATPRP